MRRMVRRTLAIVFGIMLFVGLVHDWWAMFVLSAWGLAWLATWGPS